MPVKAGPRHRRILSDNASSSSRYLKAIITRIILDTQDSAACNLSDEELVLFALSNSPDKWHKVKDIGAFIVDRVKFYKIQSASFIFDPSRAMPAHHMSILKMAIDDYLSTYGTPVHSKLDDKKQQVYSITAGAAYHFVQNRYGEHIAPIYKSTVKNTTLCPLMTIPAEIRLKIYHYVLKMPGCRLSVGKKSLSALDDKNPIWTKQRTLTMPPVSKVLALLSVSKQVHQESMPEFYGENHFDFKDMARLRDFLSRIGPERRKHMRNVSVVYSNMSAAAAGARLLTQSDTLQKLTLLLTVTKDTTGHYTIPTSRRQFDSPGQLPGFAALKRLRGINQLTFSPDHEHAAADDFLRPLVTQPKVIKVTKVKKAKKSTKRKLKELTASELGHEMHQAKSKKTKGN